jgi:hypothetical protein
MDTQDKKIILRASSSLIEVRGVFRKYAKGKAKDWKTIRAKTQRQIAKEVAKE